MAEAQISNTFSVTIDGTPLPDDVERLLVHGEIDDSLSRPDLVVLRFRDQDRSVIAKSGARSGPRWRCR